ncbi:MAG: endonuclease MutS2 [Lachnospiraceae bacterium]|nr:endonuclease MutS2 [Lachnospiraceae bacterium]
MNAKVLKTLEFHKIIKRLTEHASTPLGIRMCEDCVPFDELEEVIQAQTQTRDALARLYRHGTISFSGARDIGASLKRLEIGSSLSIPELLSVSALLSAAARARAYGRGETTRLSTGRHMEISEEEENMGDSLDALFAAIEPLPSLNQEISRCIQSEEDLFDDASPKLNSIRRSIRRASDRVHSQLNEIVNSNRTQLQDAVVTMRGGRYCIPVKAEYKNQVGGMVHDQSRNGSTYFIEPMAIVKLNNEIRELEIAEQKEIEAILADLSSQTAPHIESLRTDLSVLSQLDYIFARACLARDMDASCPQFNEAGFIDIRQGRHPLLKKDQVVPIDVTLGKEYNTLIITGPNTGGKTVSLKTVGLLTLMGQAGLHIPAFDGSKLALFREVYADIGDEQSIEQNLSTFSSHMTNIVSILEKADTNSLVLFDELCAGTDPTEGAALAVSILDFLHNMDVRVMATTHYSEIKVYALSTDGVENASCEFNVETLRPTYRLLTGIPGKSNAFAIAGKLGLPSFLIDDAGTRIGKQDKHFEDMIGELEAARVTLEQEKDEVNRYKAEISHLKEELSTSREDLKERRERYLQTAQEEARRILEEAKDTADQTIRRINKLAGGAGVSRELENERAALREKLSEAEKKTAVRAQKKQRREHTAADFRIGDAVRVLSMNLNGTVSTLPNAKGDLFVQMGILRSQVNIRDLELIDEPSVTGPGVPSGNRRKKSNMSGIGASKTMSISPEINLIGMTVDEAMPQLDKYLDDAYLAHLPQVRIIHGRGTGALRNATHKLLKRAPHVEEFHLGAFGEGDHGVTIAKLKEGAK